MWALLCSRVWLQHHGGDTAHAGLHAGVGAGLFPWLRGELQPRLTALCGLGRWDALWRCSAPSYSSGNQLLSSSRQSCVISFYVQSFELFMQSLWQLQWVHGATNVVLGKSYYFPKFLFLQERDDQTLDSLFVLLSVEIIIIIKGQIAIKKDYIQMCVWVIYKYKRICQKEIRFCLFVCCVLFLA